MSEPPAITISKEDYLYQRLCSALYGKGKNPNDKFKKSIIEQEESK